MDIIRFENPNCLWLLLLVPSMAIIYLLWLKERQKRMQRFGEMKLLKQLSPRFSKYRGHLKFILCQLILTLLILILARPMFIGASEDAKEEGIETIIALDISNSMLARDVAPSRLEKSKLLIERLVDKFSNHKVGLIIFAGDAYVQLPVTADKVSAKMFLDNIDPSLIGTQGTNIGEAIELAIKAFSKDETKGKAIVVITDGEDHEGGAEEAAKQASDLGINVFMMGVGSLNGSPIPSKEGGLLVDRNGNTVITKLNNVMCREIAAAGKGVYIHIDNSTSAEEELTSHLNRLQKGVSKSGVSVGYNDQFQAVALIVILLLILEVLILEVKQGFFSRFNLFNRKPKGMKCIIIGTFLCLAINAVAQNDRGYIRQGNKKYRTKNLGSAAQSYKDALAKNPQNALAAYNLGRTLQDMKKDSLAIDQYKQAISNDNNNQVASSAHYNMGTIYQKNKDYGKAIEAYKSALRINPKHEKARHNLALCKQKQQEQKQQKQQDNQNKDKKNQNSDDKQQQNKPNNKDKSSQQKQQKNNPQSGNMSKENADQLLSAALQNEKATQERLKKAMQQPQRRTIEKYW